MKNTIRTREKYLLLLASIILGICILLPIPWTGHAVYNRMTDTLYCDTEYACWHELGHRMDHDLKYPSRSEEFGDTLRLYIFTEILQSPYRPISDYAILILGYKGILSYSSLYGAMGRETWSSPQEEIYADIYASTKGDIEQMPSILQQFYSTQPIYREQHTCLIQNTISMCFRSIHISTRVWSLKYGQ